MRGRGRADRPIRRRTGDGRVAVRRSATGGAFCALLASLVAAMAAAAETETPIRIALPTGSLALPLPPDRCAIGPDDPQFGETFVALDDALGPTTCLLVWHVDCATLASVRNGDMPSDTLLDRYGIYATPIDAHGFLQRFQGMTRATFAREIGGRMPAFDGTGLKLTVGREASLHAGDAAPGFVRTDMGLLAFDEQAYYLATAAEFAHGGERHLLVGVAANTLIHDVVVTAIAYSLPDGVGTLTALERDAHLAIATLIDGNPGGDGSERGLRIDANHTLLIGAAVGMLFIAIGLVNVAWKWWCRRRGLNPHQ